MKDEEIRHVAQLFREELELLKTPIEHPLERRATAINLAINAHARDFKLEDAKVAEVTLATAQLFLDFIEGAK